jgi:hypothetical protein
MKFGLKISKAKSQSLTPEVIKPAPKVPLSIRRPLSNQLSSSILSYAVHYGLSAIFMIATIFFLIGSFKINNGYGTILIIVFIILILANFIFSAIAKIENGTLYLKSFIKWTKIDNYQIIDMNLGEIPTLWLRIPGNKIIKRIGIPIIDDQDKKLYEFLKEKAKSLSVSGSGNENNDFKKSL